MNKKEPHVTIRIKQDLPTYQAISSVALGALRTTLEELAKTHNNKDGKWLDELESKLIFDAKGTIASGAPISVEAESLSSAIQTIEGTIGVVRANLIQKD